MVKGLPWTVVGIFRILLSATFEFPLGAKSGDQFRAAAAEGLRHGKGVSNIRSAAGKNVLISNICALKQCLGKKDKARMAPLKRGLS
jgi:hypothetical protein